MVSVVRKGQFVTSNEDDLFDVSEDRSVKQFDSISIACNLGSLENFTVSVNENDFSSI